MNKIILGLALIFSTSMSFAQQKIGYINSEELILSMPEAKKADADISAYAKTFQDQLTTMQKELQDLQGRIQSTQQSAEEKIAAKRQDLLKPITEKADKAIQDVAKEKGYTYILDSSTGSIVYATQADNIIQDVKNKLGIKDAPKTNPK